MRARSWFAVVLVVILFCLCVRVWADPPRPQAVWRVHLPLIMRGSGLAAPTPGASPSVTASPTATPTTSATPLATFTASPSASLTHTPADTATATPTRTASPTRTVASTATPTLTATSGPSPTISLTPSPSPTAPCVSMVTQISPANLSRLDTLTPLFRFDAGSRRNVTRYELQISTQVLFVIPWFTGREDIFGGIINFQLRENLEPDTVYFWRVRLLCGQALAPWSETWSFTAGSGSGRPNVPIQISPPDGALLTSWPVTFTWSSVPTAIEYYVWWRRPEPGSYTDGIWSTATQAAGRGLEPGTVYEWAAGARNAYGLGPNSTWWRFTTPSTPPAPEDVFPSGGRFTLSEDGSVVWDTD